MDFEYRVVYKGGMKSTEAPAGKETPGYFDFEQFLVDGYFESPIYYPDFPKEISIPEYLREAFINLVTQMKSSRRKRKHLRYGKVKRGTRKFSLGDEVAIGTTNHVQIDKVSIIESDSDEGEAIVFTFHTHPSRNPPSPGDLSQVLLSAQVHDLQAIGVLNFSEMYLLFRSRQTQIIRLDEEEDGFEHQKAYVQRWKEEMQSVQRERK